ncbi:Uncharacterized conserved protein YbaP, TraB family [Chryseobacterium oleae]|uniref:Uncharacterized conserved protein YbaP, TraB family n=1 Tax=Chryseobacterium oleae TaxID=491207 RepID=A0A1I4W049_CHROL|nr:TraB/GumN family protein [Chryseobacterium oleae]SFN06657.1 Uncharacterized conserved protein YbaP, TraB family [Chryseobacterium oleae]
MENNINKRLVFLFTFFSAMIFAQETYLWKITSKNGKHISYFFGTMHMAGETFYNQYPILDQSLKSSDIVITETEIKRDKIIDEFNSRTETNDLEEKLSPEDYARLQNIFKNTGIDIKKLKRDEIVKIMQQRIWNSGCSGSDQYMLDGYIQKQGEDHGKKLIYLETSKMQKDYLQNAKEPKYRSGNAAIKWTLNKYEKTMASNDKKCRGMQNDYLNLKDQYIFNKSCESLSKGDQIIVTERNGKWMEILPGLIEENNVFLAVGLGHFSYTCGLIEKFKGLGYSVEPIPMKL